MYVSLDLGLGDSKTGKTCFLFSKREELHTEVLYCDFFTWLPDRFTELLFSFPSTYYFRGSSLRNDPTIWSSGPEHLGFFLVPSSLPGTTLQSVNSVSSASYLSAATLIQVLLIVVWTVTMICIGFSFSSPYLLPVDPAPLLLKNLPEL